jgi:hypothetical protein
MKEFMIKRVLVSMVILTHLQFCIAQKSDYPKRLINGLTSPAMQGRSSVKEGDKKAANFIKNEFEQQGIKAFGKSYFQEFTFPINTFPGPMQVMLDDAALQPVVDFVIAPESKSVKGTFPLVYLPLAADTIDSLYDSIKMLDYSGQFVVANLPKRNVLRDNLFKSSGLIAPRKSVYWWASTGNYEANVPVFVIHDSIMELQPKTISLNVENRFEKKHTARNVLGYIEGNEKPDSFVVFTAHYDHLGWMGKGNVFRGANDNASGTAMVLWLANYFSNSENLPKYSVAFLLFAGEESGLWGSSFFVKNAAFPLSRIKALINLDMVGTGSEGITLVNGEANDEIVEKLSLLNQTHSYFTDIKVSGESCNSDHCYFHRAGVPSVFIYTRGAEFQEYHNLKDVPEKLPLTKYVELYRLLIGFTETY